MRLRLGAALLGQLRSAESNVSATVEDADVMIELKTANKKRKLKNLRRFFVNRTIIEGV